MRELFQATFAGVLPLLLAMAACMIVELIVWRGKVPTGQSTLNVAFTVFVKAADNWLEPVLFFWAASLVQLAGGGIIRIETPWLAFVAVLIVGDFLRYWMHRGAHRFWWPLHALHHSDPSVNVTTTTRNHLFESQIHRLVVAVPPAVLFDVEPIIFGLVGTTGLATNLWLHLNVRLHLGRLSTLINGPQLHRIHHSNLRHHIDCNFSTLLPVWDVLFGTYYKPARDEFPETGLHDGAYPKSLVQAVIWPIRLRASRSQVV